MDNAIKIKQSRKKQAHRVLVGFVKQPELGTLIPLIVLSVFLLFGNPAFFSFTNIVDILRTASFWLLIAAPYTFLMATCGMDLSIGAVTSLGGVICALAMVNGLPIGVAIIIGLVAGALIGGVNGLLIIKAGLPPFITTLGMQYVVNGFISIITENYPVSGFSSKFMKLAQTRVLGNKIWITIIYAALIAIIAHVVLTKTKFGRRCLAIGGNRETSYLSGIKVQKISILAYVVTSIGCALSGILLASRFSSAQPAIGTGTELKIMAAIIIGGTSMFGGSGTIVGSTLGCILFAMITNALILLSVPTFWQNLIYGIILLTALFIDRYRRSLSGENV